ncbi:MAG: transporter [Ferruginibacter sp.]
MLLLPFFLPAQNVINTDRPDQSDGTHIVEKNYYQIETGAQYSRLDKTTTGFDNVSLIRYGITKKFEIRLLNQYSSIQDSSGKISGTKPPVVSIKNLLCAQHGLLPKITLVSYLKIPVTISPAFSGKYLSYAFTMVFRYDLSSGFKLYTNLGVNRDQQSREINYLSTAEINYNITQRCSAYAEYFGSYAKNNNANNGLDMGILYAIKKNLQVDVALGSPTLHLGINKFISTGISLRLPK